MNRFDKYWNPKEFPHFYYKHHHCRGRMGLLKGLILFGAGMYAGVYMDQHYKVKKIAEPKEIVDKMGEFMKNHQHPVEESQEFMTKLGEFLEQYKKEHPDNSGKSK